ncbi:MAG: TilS substrate C-terminal domain-containing protein, partial [Betaproteobacteria bacterium]
ILRRTTPDELGAALRLPCTLLLRSRRGDDQFLLKPGGTVRSLKKQFQSRARPAWERDAPVVTDEAGSLMWVHGLGWDARVPQTLGGWQLHWAPDEAPLGA